MGYVKKTLNVIGNYVGHYLLLFRNSLNHCLVLLLCIIVIGSCTVIHQDKQEITLLRANNSYIDSEANLNHLYNSTVAFVEIKDKSPEKLDCSGIFISPVLLLTARHCVITEEEVKMVHELVPNLNLEDYVHEKSFSLLTYQSYEQQKFNYSDLIYAKVVYVELNTFDNPTRDVAVLKLDATNSFNKQNNFLKSNSWLTVQQQGIKVRLGQKIYDVGMLHSKPWILTQGVVSQRIDYYGDGEGTSAYFINTYIGPGMSGGPIINEYGQLICLTIAFIAENKDSDGSDVGLCIPNYILQDFIAKAR